MKNLFMKTMSFVHKVTVYPQTKEKRLNKRTHYLYKRNHNTQHIA